jgi:hypothetical protein
VQRGRLVPAIIRGGVRRRVRWTLINAEGMPMEFARKTFVVWAVIASTVGAIATGCGNDNKAPTPSPSAAASGSQPAGYGALLMKASDIGGDFNASQPPVQNPNGAAGVEVLFANPDNSRRIGDTISIVADPAAAAAVLDSAKSSYSNTVTGIWQPADVGSNGSMISGTSPDKSQAVTVLLFTEGKALVKLEFAGAANDPIDPRVATDIGYKQDAAIKNGLPG